VKHILIRGIAAASLAFAGAAGAFAAPPAAAPAASRDWTQTVVATPEGGIRMGNPAAATKIVEYVSLTCPHCRQFAETGAPVLVRDHVASGRLSFEIRPFPLDPVAAVGAQITRCAAPAHGIALSDDILRAQTEYFARLHAVTPEQAAQIQALAPAAFRQRVASLAGFDAIAARHRIGAAALATCLSDEAGAARVSEIKAAAEALGVSGTPTFLVDGAVVEDVHDWAGLQALLAARR
jgi:protein-disulfide isomerase